MFRFAHPEYFWALLLIPALTALFVYARIQRVKALKKYGDPEILKLLMPNVSG